MATYQSSFTGENIDNSVSVKHEHDNKAILDNTTASYTSAEATKLSNITATQPIDLDNLPNSINEATQTALNLKEDKAMKGQPEGYVPLDVNGRIETPYMPINYFVKHTDTLSPVTDTNKVLTQNDAGGGDMLKSQYDTDGSGVVDNAEKVNNLTVETAVPAGAVFTDTTYTDADIKTKYEANADTNAFTDAEKALVATVPDKVDNANIGVTVQAYDANIVSDTAYVHTDNNLTDALLTLLETKKVKNVTTDAVNNLLVITYTDDTVTNLNINDIVTDVYVSGATLDATTNVLTLTSDDGGADVTVDLSDFVNSGELTSALNTKVTKVTSTDNAIVKFDGETGEVQNSSWSIYDEGSMTGTSTGSMFLTRKTDEGLIKARDYVYSGTSTSAFQHTVFGYGGTQESPTDVSDQYRIMEFVSRGAYNGGLSTSKTAFYSFVDGTPDAVSCPTGYGFDIIGTDGISTRALTLRSSGNVGIGTTAPNTRLNVSSESSVSVTPTLGSAVNSSATFTNSVNSYGLSVMPSGSGDVHLQVQRFDGSTNVYNLNLQPSGGKVGIGTTTPQQKLDVTDNANTVLQVRTTLTDGYSRLALQNTERSFLITNNANDDLAAIYYNGDNRLLFNLDDQWFANSNLGMGVAPPSDDWGNGQIYNGMGFFGSIGGYRQSIYANGYRTTSGVWKSLNVYGSTAAAAINLETQNGDITFHGIDEWADGSTVYPPTRMTIKGVSGNVGIGTTSPSEKLEVSGKIKATSINFSGLPTSSDGLTTGDVWNDGGILKIV